jgi:Zn-dependent peptidase ImmA (M78 family)
VSDDEFFRVRGRAIKAARLARQALRIHPLEPVDDLLCRIESDGVDVAILHLGDRVAGAYLDVAHGAVAFVNGAHAPQRQRFTLAHEYGHHRLGHARSVDAPPVLSDLTSEPEEMQANVFAAELLMPRPAAAAWVARHERHAVTLETVVRFAAEFGVSAEAACRRLRTAGLAARQLCERILDEIHAGEHLGMVEALGLSVPDDVIARMVGQLPRLPARIRGSALAVLLAGDVSVEQLAQHVGRRPEEIHAMLEATGLDALVG